MVVVGGVRTKFSVQLWSQAEQLNFNLGRLKKGGKDRFCLLGKISNNTYVESVQLEKTFGFKIKFQSPLPKVMVYM